MAQHTPGPWRLDNGANRYTPGFSVCALTPHGPGFPTPSATGEYCMALPPPHGKGQEAVQEANARLIAAAPCLLKALLRAEAFMCGFGGDEMQPDVDDALVEIYEAIAKATGA